MKSKLTKQNKVELIANTPEVTNAIKILTALMIEAKIKNFVQYEYVINGKTYRFKYEKLKGKKFNSPDKLKQAHVIKSVCACPTCKSEEIETSFCNDKWHGTL